MRRRFFHINWTASTIYEILKAVTAFSTDISEKNSIQFRDYGGNLTTVINCEILGAKYYIYLKDLRS